MALGGLSKTRGFETTTGKVIKQGLFEESATAHHNVGTRMQLADGRVFFYSKAGAGALGIGKNTQVAAQVANHQDMALSAASVGAKTFSATDGGTAVVANYYVNGYFYINSGGGAGQMLKVRANGASAGSAAFAIKTFDPIRTALASTPTGGLIANMFMATVQGTDEEIPSVGVPLIGVTAAYYYWSQTWGLANVFRGDTAAIGARLVAGATAGELDADNATYNPLFPLVGISMETGVGADWQPVLLQVHP